MKLVSDRFTGSGVLKSINTQGEIEDYYALIHGETTLGRHPSNRICLPLKTVSRHHARIVRDGFDFFLEDMQSSNGCFVNEEKIDRKVLSHKDMIRLGSVQFQFLQEDPYSGGASTTDQNIRLEHDGQTLLGDEVLHTQSIQDAEEALVSIDKLESVSQAREYLRSHYQLIDLIRSQPSQDRLLQDFLKIVVPAVKADRGVIMLRDPNKDELYPAMSYYMGDLRKDEEVRISSTIINRCIDQQAGILSRDASSDSRFSDAESVVAQNVQSAICTPLISRGNVLGACYLDRQATGVAFTDASLAFATHISSQLTLAIENIRMTRERIQAEQMSVIGRTMAEVSHSIKNILAVTHTGAELMNSQLKRGELEAAQKTWAMVFSGMQRMNNLAKAMLDYSRSDTTQRSEIDVNEVAQSVCQSLRSDMQESGITLNYQEEPNLKPCWVDPQGLYDAMMNLAVNSRYALVDTANPRVQIKTAKALGKRIEISVSDNGPGIPADILNRIFDPFFTTKGQEGNGMGLAMIRKFCHEMGGAVEVSSREGEGAEFRLYLPVVSQENGCGEKDS